MLHEQFRAIVPGKGTGKLEGVPGALGEVRRVQDGTDVSHDQISLETISKPRLA
jgi:hypothetical protein